MRLVPLLAVVSVVAVACGGGTSSASPPQRTAAASTTGGAACPATVDFGGSVDDHGASAAPAKTSFNVEAGDSFFSPTCVTGVRAGTIQLTAKNTGKALHNISLPAQSVDRDVAPGETVTVSMTMGATNLVYFCKYHRAAGMLGALVAGPP